MKWIDLFWPYVKYLAKLEISNFSIMYLDLNCNVLFGVKFIKYKKNILKNQDL